MFKKYMSKVRLDKIVDISLADLEFGFVFLFVCFLPRVCLCVCVWSQDVNIIISVLLPLFSKQ